MQHSRDRLVAMASSASGTGLAPFPSAQAALAVLFGWRADNFDDGCGSRQLARSRQGKNNATNKNPLSPTC
jgi:hypothetical protein